MDSIYGTPGTLGRNWATCAKAETRELGDCVQVTLTWKDSEYVRFLEDGREDAIKTLADLGFAPCTKS